MKPIKHPLNDRIREMNLTQEQFAKICGVSMTTIHNIVSGFSRSKGIYETDKHQYKTIERVARGLHCSIREAERICNAKPKL